MTTRSDVMWRHRIGEVPYTSMIRWTAELGSACCGLGPGSSPFPSSDHVREGCIQEGLSRSAAPRVAKPPTVQEPCNFS
jgi:hypothetical protein